MTAADTLIIVFIALAVGLGLIFVGVLIQWSLRKARPSIPQAPPQSAPPEFPPPTPPAQEPPAIDDVGPSPRAAPHALPEAQAEPRAVAAETPKPETARAPVRIGIGLRKTRENFLARIRSAITGTKKADEIYEGLEEALIAADVGVDAWIYLSAA
ncbi:MAG: hypothetical protein ACYDC3_17535, partial [Candidatus Binataceae bacterium]